MALPILTWNQTTPVSTGSLTPTDQQVVDAANTAITASTYWRILSSAAGYIEIAPKVGSAIANFRAILATNPGAGTSLTPDTIGAAIWIGIAPPRVSDGAAPTLGTWNTSTPYGADRWAGYWRTATTALVENVYLIESDEILAIIFTDDSATVVYACVIGAIFIPPNLNANSAESDGRIYGIITSGSGGLGGSLWGGSTNFMGHDSAANGPHIGIFKPTAPATFQSIARCSTTINTTKYTGLDNSLNHLPLYYQQTGGAQYYIGKLRQIYVTQDFSNRTVLTNSAATVKGYTLSQSINPGTADTISFMNA